MFEHTIIGVDLGATAIKVGKVAANQITENYTCKISSQGSEEQVVNEIIRAIEQVFDDDIAGIGIGVPSLVDVEKGIVYDVQNIPSWKEVHLKEIVEDRLKKPVYINNDANCFAVGEKYFGKGQRYKNLVGLTIGTGLGAGIIINNRLYPGNNCGAGEFGSIPYQEHIYEYYCSGQFFVNEYGETGSSFYQKAKDGNAGALKIFKQFGSHLGEVIKTILFAVDPEAVLLGGSISQSFPFFQEAMWRNVKTFPYQHTIRRLVIEPTATAHIAILGAAALYYDAQM